MRIAIVKLSAMGDIVHAMIVLQYIKNFNPKISIDWIVEESFKDLLKLNPHINKLHLVNIKDVLTQCFVQITNHFLATQI